MLAEILTGDGYGVLNLGPDTPPASLVAALRDAGRLADVVVSVVDIERRPAARRLLAAARRERLSVPLLIGGNAVENEQAALELGADRDPCSAPGDRLVPPADLRGSGELLPEYERYCWRTCQQPGAYRAPLAFVSGLLNDPRAEAAYQRLANATLLVFGDHPRFTDPAAAEALVAANADLDRITIKEAGDLPQIEQPDETAAMIDRFLA